MNKTEETICDQSKMATNKKKENNIGVTIKIIIKGKEIELTIEEANLLKSLLNEALKDKEVYSPYLPYTTTTTWQPSAEDITGLYDPPSNK